MEAFPERAHQLPLNTSADANCGYNLYKWHVAELPQSNREGSRSYQEAEDNFHHTSQRYPWINDRRPFESLAEGVSEYSNISLSPSITLNSDFSHLLRAHVPEEGFKESSGASTSQWERHLSHHYGLYSPAMASDSLNADDVRLKTNHFANTLELDDPTDPCRLLALQEYQCLQAMQTLVAPQGASKNCVKWFNEWQQCKWDQEKITKGYNFLEDRSAAKHKPYIGAPDFQYS